MARPNELTPFTQKVIVENVRAGVAGAVAAMAAGVSRSTYFDWMRRGREGEAPFLEFSDAVTRAKAQAEQAAVRCITDAMDDDPKMAVEYLRRARSKRWEPKQRSEVKAEIFDPTKLTIEEKRKLLVDIAERAKKLCGGE